MPGISSLFRRLGFVKLDDYGLLLTSEGRILSTRPTVLDDGLGGKIVGWREGDLAAMELDRWHGMKVAPAAAPIPRPIPKAIPKPISVEVAAPIAMPVAPIVEAHGETEDDEWEWEIAMARSRAAAEWAEEAAAAPAFTMPSRTAPIAVVAMPKPDPIVADQWPKTEELHNWETPAAIKSERVVKPILAAGTAPSLKTVIPVPSLPRVTDPKLLRPAPSNRPAVAPKRYPRATGKVDDTVRTQAVPANDDRTSPGIAMPPARGASGAMRVAAKQR